MLFGRRKPGFAKEVELRPEDIVGEFSDRNDPARQDQNPKFEKNEMGDQAQKVIDGTAKSAAENEKVDLFEYMDSLPEEPDPFTPSENPMIEDPNAEPEMVELKPGEMLAEFIRERTRSVNLTPYKELAKEEPLLDEMIAEMRSLENCQDIKSVVGEKDEYFFSIDIMAKNYAMISMLVYEKDLPRTLATMTRHNCKVYPSRLRCITSPVTRSLTPSRSWIWRSPSCRGARSLPTSRRSPRGTASSTSMRRTS